MSQKEQVLTALKACSEPLAVAAIRRATGISDTSLRRVLGQLEASGDIRKTPKGEKGGGSMWFLAETKPAQAPQSTSRRDLVEELLEIETVIEEAQVRRVQILEQLTVA